MDADERQSIPRLSVLDDLANRVVELAESEFEKVTLDIYGYDDGDYRVRAFTTHIVNGKINGRTEYRYNRNKETIDRRYSKFDKTKLEYIAEETTVVEQYTDPT